MVKKKDYLISISFFLRIIASIIRINPMIETKSGIVLSLNNMDVPVAIMRRKPKTANGRDNFDIFD